MSDWKKTDYGTPQDKDWLDRAREPSAGPKVAVWVIGIAVAAVVSLGLLAYGVFL